MQGLRGHRTGQIGAALLLATLLAVPATPAPAVDPSTLTGKVLLGYQGWFRCPGGGSAGTNWSHWANGTPSAATLTIDMYPDLREFDGDELCAVPNMSIGTEPARLFSSGNSKTVARHFRWMQQYGLEDFTTLNSARTRMREVNRDGSRNQIQFRDERQSFGCAEVLECGS